MKNKYFKILMMKKSMSVVLQEYLGMVIVHFLWLGYVYATYIGNKTRDFFAFSFIDGNDKADHGYLQ